jgi:uncharacterized protein (TIGR02099 family)
LTKRVWLRRAVKWLLTSFFSLLVLVGFTLGGFTLLMARVPAYRAQMQSWMSAQAKLDIEFASLSASWRGYGPELIFTQAQVRSADKQRVLAIADRGSVGFDLWQALRTGHLAAARLSLDGTELKVQRLANGEFELVGQADWPEYQSNNAFKLESLPVGELLIRNVRINFRDLKTGRGPWVLDQVTLDVTRDIVAGNDVLSVQGRANLPALLGKDLRFNATGRGHLQTVSQLSWQAEVIGTDLDLTGWAQTMPADWFAPNTGVGSFRIEAALTGIEPRHIAGQFHFNNVLLKVPQWHTPLPLADPLQVRADDPEAEPVAAQPVTVAAQAMPMMYDQINLEFTSDKRSNGWLTSFTQLQFNTEAHAWPVGTAQVLLDFDADQPGVLNHTQGHIDHVVLDNLWPLLVYLPDTENNARLRALNITGALDNLAFNYVRDPAGASPSYGVRSDITDLGLSPVGKWPGATGLSGTLSATGARGELRLNSRNLEIAIPRIFRTPLPADEVVGALTWTRDSGGVHLKANDLQVRNANGSAQATIMLEVPADGSSPIIDMHATGDGLDVASAPRYMPAGIMHRRVLAWLDEAFPKGTVQHAEATLKGPLRHFPFRDGSGLFLINAHIENLTMNYQPNYQPATGLVVDAEFRNQGLNAKATAGDVNGLALLQAHGSIADFRDSQVRVDAHLEGVLDRGLDYVQRSPIGPSIGSLFQRLQGQGNLSANAKLYLPLKNLKRYRVDIDANLNQARVSLPDVSEAATNVSGQLHVHNDTITAATLHGDFLQGKFSSNVQPVARGLYNIVATGEAQASSVMRLLKLPSWVRLSGVSDYRFTLPGYAARDAKDVRRLYSIDSDLQGLTVALPEPLGKPADAQRNFHLDAELHGQDVMQLRGSLDTLRALAQLRQSNDQWQFDRAGVRADAQNASLPAQPGVRVEGRIDEFTLDDWLKLGNNAASSPLSSASGTVHLQDVLRSANVTIGKFRLYGFVWPELRALLQATDNGWRIDVASNDATGQVVVPYSFDGGRALSINMDELHMRQEDQLAGANVNADKLLDPRELPSVQADIRRFRFGEHDFGALRGAAARSNKGLVANDLHINGDSFSGTGSGSWLQLDDGPQCSFNLTVESTDVRSTMQQFNYGDFITGKSGKLIAKLSWPGGVDAQLLGRASGTLELQLTDGQLLSVQPGAGRVLGLLSVAALPRRLGLDFRDLTDKGLAYDSIHADFTVTNGDAKTQNLVLHGPAAEVGVVGRMGLGTRDYDQTAMVTGDVGNALPVAGTAIGGPVVGAALLLFSKVFKEPLKGVARAYYHIGGTWDDPKVERIDADTAKASMSATESESGASTSATSGTSTGTATGNTTGKTP